MPGSSGLVFLASLLVALALANRLQRLISDPILLLARVTRSVAQEKNYSLRAQKQSNDEFGQLVDGFNEMLAQIQTARCRSAVRARGTFGGAGGGADRRTGQFPCPVPVACWTRCPPVSFAKPRGPVRLRECMEKNCALKLACNCRNDFWMTSQETPTIHYMAAGYEVRICRGDQFRACMPATRRGSRRSARKPSRPNRAFETGFAPIMKLEPEH